MSDLPAFPCLPPLGPGNTSAEGYPYASQGMTLRDYFAAKAMQSLLTVDGTTYFDNRAREAYSMADAMLKAREL